MTFSLAVPNETRLHFLKLTTPRREPVMSIFNPGLELYDLEPCQCENCKAKRAQEVKNEK